MGDDTKGLALMYVHLPRESWPEGIDEPKVGIVIQGKVEAKQTLDTWQKFLLLPEGYDVVGAFFDIVRQTWVFTVASAEIPQSIGELGQSLPILTATYQMDFNEGVRTVSICNLRLIPYGTIITASI